MLENYHTHTFRCRHATGTEEEYIQHAIDHGLKVLGFSDHTPFLFPGSYYSTMRMFPDQIGDYARTVLNLKEKYAGQLEIRLGLEVEYYPDRMADLLELIKPHGIEYMLLAQHWCGNEEGEPYNARPTESVEQLERYCNQSIEAMQTGLFSYMAHPDLLNFTGDPAVYRCHMTRLCETAKALDIPLEINFWGLRNQRNYPNETFWRIAGDVGCKAVFGSDAHETIYVTDAETEANAMAIVRKYGLQLLEHVPIHPYTDSPLAR